MLRVVNTVISHAVLRIVIGTDFFTARTRTYHTASGSSTLRLLLAFFKVKKARTQNAKRFFLVLNLAFFVLLNNDNSRRNMSKAHGRISRIYALTARSSGTHNVNADITRLYLDFSFLCFRKNGNGYRRRLKASLTFRCRNALNAVNA